MVPPALFRPAVACAPPARPPCAARGVRARRRESVAVPRATCPAAIAACPPAGRLCGARVGWASPCAARAVRARHRVSSRPARPALLRLRPVRRAPRHRPRAAPFRLGPRGRRTACRWTLRARRSRRPLRAGGRRTSRGRTLGALRSRGPLRARGRRTSRGRTLRPGSGGRAGRGSPSAAPVAAPGPLFLVRPDGGRDERQHERNRHEAGSGTQHHESPQAGWQYEV